MALDPFRGTLWGGASNRKTAGPKPTTVGRVNQTAAPARTPPRVPSGGTHNYAPGTGPQQHADMAPYAGPIDIEYGYGGAAGPPKVNPNVNGAAVLEALKPTIDQQMAKDKSRGMTGSPQSFEGLMAFFDQMGGMDNADFENRLAWLGTQRGFAGDALAHANKGQNLNYKHQSGLADLVINNYGRDKGFLDRALALQGQLRNQDDTRQDLAFDGTKLDESDLRSQFARSQRQLDDEYTARGAWMAPERSLSHTDLRTGFDNNLGRIDLSRKGINVNRDEIGTRRGQDQLDYDKQLAALGDNDAKARLQKAQAGDLRDYGIEGNTLQWRQAMAGLGNAEARLGIEQSQVNSNRDLELLSLLISMGYENPWQQTGDHRTERAGSRRRMAEAIRGR